MFGRAYVAPKEEPSEDFYLGDLPSAVDDSTMKVPMLQVDVVIDVSVGDQHLPDEITETFQLINALQDVYDPKQVLLTLVIDVSDRTSYIMPAPSDITVLDNSNGKVTMVITFDRPAPGGRQWVSTTLPVSS